MIDEKEALDKKIAELSTLVDGEDFKTLAEDERVDVKLQLYFMQGYSLVLANRIKRNA